MDLSVRVLTVVGVGETTNRADRGLNAAAEDKGDGKTRAHDAIGTALCIAAAKAKPPVVVSIRKAEEKRAGLLASQFNLSDREGDAVYDSTPLHGQPTSDSKIATSINCTRETLEAFLAQSFTPAD